jgi:mannosyltransferase
MSIREDSPPAPAPAVGLPTASGRVSSVAGWVRAHADDMLGMLGPALLLGLLAIHDIGLTSFWRDEISSVVFSHAPIPDLLKIIGRERAVAGLPNMATYYLILHFWLMVGETEARVRFFSVVAGVATVIPVYLTGKRIAGWWAGFGAAALFALIPYVVHYSQDARGYSLSMLVAATLTYMVIKATDRQTTGWWAAYGVVAALGLYVHFFVALVIGAHGLWVLATRQIPRWRGVLAAGIPLAIAVAPIPLIVMQYGTKHGWIDELDLHRLTVALSTLAGGQAALVAVIIALVLMVAIGRRNKLVWLLAATVLLPIVITAAASTVKPLFVPRYLIVVLPAVATVAGVAIAWLRTTPLRAAALVLVGIIFISALPTAYPPANRQDWRSAAHWVAGEIRPSDRFVVPAAGRRQLEYYLNRFGIAMPPSLGVADVKENPQDGRVWILLNDSDLGPATARQLGPAYGKIDDRSWGGRIRLMLFERVPDTE